MYNLSFFQYPFMVSLFIMSSNCNEQNIKRNLILYDSQDISLCYEKAKKMNVKRYKTLSTIDTFEEVSDWTNQSKNYESHIITPINYALTVPKNAKNSNIRSIISSNRTLSRTCSKKQQLLISPINVKFRKEHKYKSYKSHDQKRKPEFKIKQMNLSIYDSIYKPLAQLYHKKINPQTPITKQSTTDEPLSISSYIHHSKFPKAEKASVIMRVLKKRQQILTFRKICKLKTYSNHQSQDP